MAVLLPINVFITMECSMALIAVIIIQTLTITGFHMVLVNVLTFNIMPSFMYHPRHSSLYVLTAVNACVSRASQRV